MIDERFYKPATPLSVAQMIEVTSATVSDGVDLSLTTATVASLKNAQQHDLSFFENKKYLSDLKETKAGFCFVPEKYADAMPQGTIALVSETPYKDYALVAQKLYPEPSWTRTYIAESASIHRTAKIGSNCIIDHGVYIGKNVVIGSNTWIKPNTVIGHGVEIGDHTVIGSNSTLTHCVIGSGCRFLAGVRIGQDGFGFAIDPSGHVPVPQLGRVLVGDRVHIGANTTIDRGSVSDTVIGDGCFIDNLVQIAHNVKLGKHCILVACSAVSGSTELEDYVVLAGQAGLAGHLKIGRGARIGAQAGIMRDVEAGVEVLGSPAVPVKEFFKQYAALSKLSKKGS